VEVVEMEVAVGGSASVESLASAAQAHAEADTALAALAAVPKRTRTKMNISRAVAAFCCNHIAAQLANLAEENMAYMLVKCKEGAALAKLPATELAAELTD
jgi:hypothetical protein